MHELTVGSVLRRSLKCFVWTALLPGSIVFSILAWSRDVGWRSVVVWLFLQVPVFTLVVVIEVMFVAVNKEKE